jgi:hypothetical protein
MDDISATRLSRRDPVGFPPHPHGWLSIIVYQYKFGCILTQNGKKSIAISLDRI